LSLREIEPVLFVSSIERSVEFYEEKLGFDLGFAMTGDGGRMLHASVVNGSVKIMLGYADPSAEQRLGGGAELYIYAGDVDEYYERVRSAGTELTRDIEDQFWGDRTFTVTDPDGYVLTFAQTVRTFDPSRDIPAIPATV
jgi:PhnB protein